MKRIRIEFLRTEVTAEVELGDGIETRTLPVIRVPQSAYALHEIFHAIDQAITAHSQGGR